MLFSSLCSAGTDSMHVVDDLCCCPPRNYPQAEETIVKQKYDKEYLPITGFPEFTKHAALLAYGKDSKPLKEGRVCQHAGSP